MNTTADKLAAALRDCYKLACNCHRDELPAAIITTASKAIAEYDAAPAEYEAERPDRECDANCARRAHPMAECDCSRAAAPMALDIDAIADALRKARPMTTAGTFNPSRAENVKGQMIGWRYTVTKMADALRAHHGSDFDRAAFLDACTARAPESTND